MAPVKTCPPLAAPLVAAATLLAACSADQYRRDADREVSDIIEQKEERLFGSATGFTIETARDALRRSLLDELDGLRAGRKQAVLEEVMPPRPGDEPSGPARPREDARSAATAESARAIREKLEARLADVERRHDADLRSFEVTDPPLLPLRVLTLNDALQIASDNSREYQSQKEQVYLVALDLTFERYLFSARFGVTSSYDWSSSPGDPRQRDGALNTNLSITQQLASGGLLVFDFTNSLLQRFTGIEFTNGKNHSTSSLIDLSFSQPLLRGFGADIVQEPLVQAERNVVYQLRNFERFRQEFAVSIAAEYYNLVRQIDQIANARRTYIQFIDSREQSEELKVRGRRTQIQLDQAVQSELNARNNWIVAQRSYQDALDRFKVTLGLPIEATLAPDSGELEALTARGVRPARVGEEAAIAIALHGRLDHVNQVEQLEDRERRVNVAADDLRAALDVGGSVSFPTADDQAFGFRSNDATWRAGATLDLPVDKLAERNAYRRALISRDAQARTVSLSEDQVKEQVRDALRRLAQLRETYRIALESVDVAERRVQSTAISLRMGRIEIRDALDATNALNSARNSLTQALVDHEIARFELARDMGLLELTERGIGILEMPAAPRG